MDIAENGMTDSEREKLEKRIVKALLPITREHGIDVTVEVHPRNGEPSTKDGASVRFFFRR